MSNCFSSVGLGLSSTRYFPILLSFGWFVFVLFVLLLTSGFVDFEFLFSTFFVVCLLFFGPSHLFSKFLKNSSPLILFFLLFSCWGWCCCCCWFVKVSSVELTPACCTVAAAPSDCTS